MRSGLEDFFCLLCWGHPSKQYIIAAWSLLLVLDSSADYSCVYATLWWLPLALIRRLANSCKDLELETQHLDFLPYVPSSPALVGDQLNNSIVHQTVEHSAVIIHLEKFTAWGKGHSSNMNPNIREGWGYKAKGFSHKGNIVLKIKMSKVYVGKYHLTWWKKNEVFLELDAKSMK